MSGPFVQPQHKEDIWLSSSGLVQTGARGTSRLVQVQHLEGIWRCCSGPEKTDVLGMVTLACTLLKKGI